MLSFWQLGYTKKYEKKFFVHYKYYIFCIEFERKILHFKNFCTILNQKLQEKWFKNFDFFNLWGTETVKLPQITLFFAIFSGFHSFLFFVFLGFRERDLALHIGQIGEFRWICWWQERQVFIGGCCCFLKILSDFC